MTFYDYDLHCPPGATSETYILRADRKRLPDGHYCRIKRVESQWLRKTAWGAKAGTRYSMFNSLDDALASGIAWARRRERQEKHT